MLLLAIALGFVFFPLVHVVTPQGHSIAVAVIWKWVKGLFAKKAASGPQEPRGVSINMEGESPEGRNFKLNVYYGPQLMRSLPPAIGGRSAAPITQANLDPVPVPMLPQFTESPTSCQCNSLGKTTRTINRKKRQSTKRGTMIPKRTAA
jgi:hypothetical protein